MNICPFPLGYNIPSANQDKSKLYNCITYTNENNYSNENFTIYGASSATKLYANSNCQIVDTKTILSTIAK